LLLAPVLTEIGRLEKLVKDLLLYSKPCQAAARRFDCHEFAAGLQPFVADVIGKRAIRFEIECEAFEIKTDPDLLKELLLNLLRNAVEALALMEEGSVRLRASAGPPLVIAVEDNGPGMTPTVEGHLFEPFYTTKASGTGLGLSVARKLAQALGAELQFRPIAPHGTRVELRFEAEHDHDGGGAKGRINYGTYTDH
jgi:signal transduction histidine kinase